MSNGAGQADLPPKKVRTKQVGKKTTAKFDLNTV